MFEIKEGEHIVDAYDRYMKETAGYTDLKVEYKTRGVRLSQRLITQKGLSASEVNTLKLLHFTRMVLEECIEETVRLLSEVSKGNGKITYTLEIRLRDALAAWRENQYLLQDTWKFERNPNYFREWTLPGCTCPKMDNEDRYPYGRVISDSCLIHGKEIV